MKPCMLLSAAALSLLVSPVALAAQAQTVAPTDAPAPPPPSNDLDAQQMPQEPVPPAPPADPNANVPTGAVPDASGMVPADPYAPKDPAAPVGSPANPAVVGGNVTPPPEAKADYPLCTRTLQDSCVNPSEAKRAKKR